MPTNAFHSNILEQGCPTQGVGARTGLVKTHSMLLENMKDFMDFKCI